MSEAGVSLSCLNIIINSVVRYEIYTLYMHLAWLTRQFIINLFFSFYFFLRLWEGLVFTVNQINLFGTRMSE